MPFLPPCCVGTATFSRPCTSLLRHTRDIALAMVGSSKIALYPPIKLGLPFPLYNGRSHPPVSSGTLWDLMAHFKRERVDPHGNHSSVHSARPQHRFHQALGPCCLSDSEGIAQTHRVMVYCRERQNGWRYIVQRIAARGH